MIDLNLEENIILYFVLFYSFKSLHWSDRGFNLFLTFFYEKKSAAALMVWVEPEFCNLLVFQR